MPFYSLRYSRTAVGTLNRRFFWERAGRPKNHLGGFFASLCHWNFSNQRSPDLLMCSQLPYVFTKVANSGTKVSGIYGRKR